METIKTKKFIDNTISIRKMLPFKKEIVTALNLLILMSKGRCEKYPTRDLYSKALNHAYAMRVFTGISGYGNQILFEKRIKYIRSELIGQPGYLDEVLQLAEQSLRHPVLGQAELEEARYLLKNRLVTMQDDPDQVALMEAMKQAQAGHHIEIPVYGYMEEVDSISLEQIHALWQEIGNLPSQVLYVGDLEPEVLDFLKPFDQTVYQGYTPTLIQACKPAFKTLTKDVSQSSLCQIYATEAAPDGPDAFGLLVFNSVLGQAPMSLLFENVREKNSFCYSISSSLIRFDGALVICTGTSREYVDKVRELIAEQIDTLKRKDYEPGRLEAAKLDLVDGLDGQRDSDAGMLSQRFLNHLLSREMDTEDLKRHIQAVTMEDLARIAGRLHLVSEVTVLETGEDL